MEKEQTNMVHEELKEVYMRFRNEQVLLTDSLQALAEEASELSQACLQTMRSLGIGIRSRKSREEVLFDLSSEMADVLSNIGILINQLDMRKMVSKTDMESRIISIMDRKMIRHMELEKYPWKEYMDKNKQKGGE